MDDHVPDMIQQLMRSMDNGFLGLEEALIHLATAMSLQPHCAHFTHEGKTAIQMQALKGTGWDFGLRGYLYGGWCAICHARFDAKTTHRLAHAHLKPGEVPEFRSLKDFAVRELLPVVSPEDLQEMAEALGKHLDATRRRALIRALVAHDTVQDIFQEAA